MLKDAEDDFGYQKTLHEKCADGIDGLIFFFQYFLFTANPRTPQTPDYPFLAYPKQVDLIRETFEAIEAGESLLIEKSRDWGATYIVLGVLLWFWIFRDSTEIGLLSLKEDEVDDLASPSSMFGKIRYMAELLPRWIMPKKFSWKLDSVKLKFKNPGNRNTFLGKATTPDAFRSGRKTVVLVDEYAAIPQRVLEGLERSLRYVTNTIIRLSTPRGVNQFKKIRDKRLCRIFTCHWTQNPDKCENLYTRDDNGMPVPCNDLPWHMRSRYGFLITKAGITSHRLRSDWYDKEDREAVNRRDLDQEVNIRYIGSGYCRFSEIIIENKSLNVEDGVRGRLIEETEGEIVFKESLSGEPFDLEVWHFPPSMPWDNYSAIGVDTAEGLAHGDFCSADVAVRDLSGNVDDALHAAALHGHWKPDIFADKLDILGRWYHNAFMVVERNKDGLGILLRLERDYEKRPKQEKDPFSAETHLGFNTTQHKKYLITGDLDEAIREDEFLIKSMNSVQKRKPPFLN